MNRHNFLEKLEAGLRGRRIEDIGEIVSQYEEHFAYKLADGYSEEEIAAKLGNPDALAAQFADGGATARAPRALTVAGVATTDIFAGLLFALLVLWTAVMAIFAVAAAATGVVMALGVNPYGLIPPMPGAPRMAFAATLAALGLLSAVGCAYFWALVRRLMRAYAGHRRASLDASAGRAVLPPSAPRPLFSARANRRLRRLSLVALCAFVVCFTLGYVLSAASAGALEFWHAWNWFEG